MPGKHDTCHRSELVRREAACPRPTPRPPAAKHKGWPTPRKKSILLLQSPAQSAGKLMKKFCEPCPPTMARHLPLLKGHRKRSANALLLRWCQAKILTCWPCAALQSAASAGPSRADGPPISSPRGPSLRTSWGASNVLCTSSSWSRLRIRAHRSGAAPALGLSRRPSEGFAYLVTIHAFSAWNAVRFCQ